MARKCYKRAKWWVNTNSDIRDKKTFIRDKQILIFKVGP
jgi:hypothetical protein